MLGATATGDSVLPVVATLEQRSGAVMEPHDNEVRAWGYRPALDGLRAVAVYLVIAFHAEVFLFRGGFIGVDLFFVLSGFVVTNVLWSELESTGTVRLRQFYARRLRRLTPAALVCVVGTALALLLVASLPERLDVLDDARAALLYFANWHFLGESTDYFAAAENPSPLLHFWSLAIEEQFYALFPLTLLGLHRLGRRVSRPMVVPAGLATIAAASLLAQLFWSNRDSAWAYYGTDARLYQLLAGCLFAVAMRRFLRIRTHPLFGGLAVVGLALLLIGATNHVDITPSVRGMLAAAASIFILVGLEYAPDGLLGRLLGRPLPVYLGSISYGVYLWHWPIILITQRFVTVQPVTLFVLSAIMASSLAALSHRLVEQPVRKSPVLDARPKRVVAVGLGLTVCTALVVVPPILESVRTPRVTVASQNAPMIVAASPDLPGFVDPVPPIDYEAIRSHRVEVPDCYLAGLDECTVRRGGESHVLLIGDSVAQQFIPAFETLAAQHDWTLSLNVWSACTWQTGLLPRPDISESNAQRCQERRTDWYPTAIEALDPDIIVLAAVNRDDVSRWGELIRAEDEALGDATLHEVLARTTRDTLDLLERSSSAEIVVIEPPPLAPTLAGPTDCLASVSTVGQCSFELPPATPTEFVYRAEAIVRDRVSSVDFDSLVCPDTPVCMPIIDGIPVWRDGGHLNHVYVEHITQQIDEALSATGAFSRS